MSLENIEYSFPEMERSSRLYVCCTQSKKKNIFALPKSNPMNPKRPDLVMDVLKGRNMTIFLFLDISIHLCLRVYSP